MNEVAELASLAKRFNRHDSHSIYILLRMKHTATASGTYKPDDPTPPPGVELFEREQELVVRLTRRGKGWANWDQFALSRQDLEEVLSELEQ